MVPLARIGLATPSLPMTCSTTELQRRQLKENIQTIKIKIKYIFHFCEFFYTFANRHKIWCKNKKLGYDTNMFS